MKRLDYERRTPSLRGHARNAAEAVMFLAAVARERQRLGQERQSLEKRLKRIDSRLISIAAQEGKLTPLIRAERPAAAPAGLVGSAAARPAVPSPPGGMTLQY